MFGALVEKLLCVDEGRKSAERAFVDTGIISTYVFGILDKLDPTPTKKYLEWMCREYLVAQSEDVLYLPNVIKDIKNAVADFDNLVKRKKITNPDIYQYSLNDLETEVDENRKEVKELSREGVDTVYETDRFLIISPLTFDASQRFGSNNWCTVYSLEYWNEYYYDREVALYYIFDTDFGGGRWAVSVNSDDKKEAWKDEKGDNQMDFHELLEKLGLEDKEELFEEADYEERRNEKVSLLWDEKIVPAATDIVLDVLGGYVDEQDGLERHVYPLFDKYLVDDVVQKVLDAMDDFEFLDDKGNALTRYEFEEPFIKKMIELGYATYEFSDDVALKRLGGFLNAYKSKGDISGADRDEMIDFILSMPSPLADYQLEKMTLEELMAYIQELYDVARKRDEAQNGAQNEVHLVKELLRRY